MRGGYGPIGQQLQATRGQMRRPGVMEPPEMDEDMEYPGRGNMGIEMMEGAPTDENIYEPGLNTMPQGRAIPVHSRAEIDQEYGQMGMRVPKPMQNITSAYEAAPQGSPIRDQLHSAQHQMKLNDKNTVNQTKRMMIQQKRQQLVNKILQLKSTGRDADADMMRKQLDVFDASLEKMIGMIPE